MTVFMLLVVIIITLLIIFMSIFLFMVLIVDVGLVYSDDLIPVHVCVDHVHVHARVAYTNVDNGDL